MDKYEELRAAMKAATPGPWYLRTNRHTTTDGRPWGWLDLYPPGSMRQASPSGVSVTWERGDKSEANATYIAACHPETIRALLAERDALRSALEAIVSHHDDYFKDSATESNMPWIGQARAALAQEQGGKE